MPSIGIPKSNTFLSHIGAFLSNTLFGLPEKIIPAGDFFLTSCREIL